MTFDDQELLPPWEGFHIYNNIIGGFPIYVEEVVGNSVVPSRDYPVPHAKEGGSLALGRWILASLQGIPQDLMCGDQGTTHVLHVPLMMKCGTMEIQGGDREDDHHDVMRSTHPCIFYKVDEPKEVIGFCSGSKDRLVHSYMQSPFDDDVSFHGDIFLGRPLDQQRRRDASHVEAPFIIYFLHTF